MNRLPTMLLVCLVTFAALAGPGRARGQGPDLDRRLLAEGLPALAKAARASGDAARGAIVFHQAQNNCAKCHATDGTTDLLGPNLAALDPRPSDEALAEAVLEPSKTIRKGYETLLIVTADGRTLSGLLAEESPAGVTLRDAAQPGQLVKIPSGDIQLRRRGSESLMPAGLANQLGGRQALVDLLRYLIEIRDGGPERARQLRPDPALVALRLPEYESRVDHAGLIAALDQAALERGRAIYQSVCVNCHGTIERPGSLPTSLRFASGKFKSGSDPLSIYQTLTRGFGQMAPQTWMVPSQKYDVIHYLRETYLKPHNPSQYLALTPEYLAALPKGDTRGPEPVVLEPWVTMDYGPSLIGTYEAGDDGRNFAHKGIAARLDAGPGGVSRGRAWTIFDHDTFRLAAAWRGEGFVDWNCVHFNGAHSAHPRPVGELLLANPSGPGWADPASGSWADDRRLLGRDGRRYGPLPRAWAQFHGLYHHGLRTIASYAVGATGVLETWGTATAAKQAASGESVDEEPILTRSFQLGARPHALTLLVATLDEPPPPLAPLAGGARFGRPDDPRAVLVGVTPATDDCRLLVDGQRLCLRIAAGSQALSFAVWAARGASRRTPAELAAAIPREQSQPDWKALTAGGPPRWPQKLTTEVSLGADDGPLAVDVLTHPEANPWLARMRFTGLDFLPDGDRMVVCAWDGDVWLVSGLRQVQAASPGARPRLEWQRIASGLFQPLGIKHVAGRTFVTCRDQLVILRDLNGDGETDFYQCFNNDHQVTEHFHEFAMGLQVDGAGNFYYAKSARHALPAVVPHHGTLLRVSPDGARTEILATGFRAANGVCLNDDGSFVVTDQEGHWNPKNRINWVTPGGFYGNMFGYHDVTDSSDAAMRQPLCWITNSFDCSPAELLWTPRDAWGPLAGRLLNLSYGYGKLYVVPFEDVAGQKQGGMCALPMPALPTGAVRGRFHPADRQLYVCGMFAWAGSATQPGGLYRIRRTGRPLYLPVELRARPGRIEIGFTDPLSRKAATDASQFALKTWSLRRTADYGSDHHQEQPLPIDAAELSPDGRTLTLRVSRLEPCWCMEIVCKLTGADGTRCERVIHNSIFALGK